LRHGEKARCPQGFVRGKQGERDQKSTTGRRLRLEGLGKSWDSGPSIDPPDGETEAFPVEVGQSEEALSARNSDTDNDSTSDDYYASDSWEDIEERDAVRLLDQHIRDEDFPLASMPDWASRESWDFTSEDFIEQELLRMGRAVWRGLASLGRQHCSSSAKLATIVFGEHTYWRLGKFPETLRDWLVLLEHLVFEMLEVRRADRFTAINAA
jgi:hypothetical protein